MTVVPAGIAPAPGRRPARDRAWVPVVGTATGDGPGSGLPTFLEAARRVLDSGVNAEFVLAGLGDLPVIVVDDASPDGTGEIADRRILRSRSRRVVRRAVEALGLAHATSIRG